MLIAEKASTVDLVAFSCRERGMLMLKAVKLYCPNGWDLTFTHSFLSHWGGASFSPHIHKLRLHLNRNVAADVSDMLFVAGNCVVLLT